MRVRFDLLLLVLGLAGQAAAQPVAGVRPYDRLIGRTAAAMAFHELTGRTVLFGGTSPSGPVLGTWTSTGRGWICDRGGVQPPPLGDWAAAHDRGRGRVVLFGGGNGVGARTWEWDGRAWADRTPPTSPPPRTEHSVAYDVARRCVVLHGGIGVDGTALSDTWLWDGATWRAMPAWALQRARFGMAYDERRARVVVFGGQLGPRPIGDTWEWDGTAWSFVVSAAGSLRPGADTPLCYDPVRQQVVASAGENGELYAFDGTRWNALGVGGAASVPPRSGHGLVHDHRRGALVLHGGDGRADTYELRSGGGGWRRLVAHDVPLPNGTRSAAWDPGRGRVVAFGGPVAPETWEFDGYYWQQIIARSNAQSNAVLAYDHANGAMMAFGGGRTSVSSNQHLVYTGSSWQSVASAPRPSPRQRHAMASDPSRGRVLVFGGRDLSGPPFGDAWEWDGVAWSQLPGMGAPSARYDAAMVYWPKAAAVALFGGQDAIGPWGDTWLYRAGTWARLAPRQSPPALAGARLTVDPASGDLLLVGGEGFGGVPSDAIWRFDGATWLAERVGVLPPRRDAVVVADTLRGQVVVQGGTSVLRSLLPVVLADTWLIGGPSRALSLEVAKGCHAGAGTLVPHGEARFAQSEFGLGLFAAEPSALAAIVVGLRPGTTPIPGSACALAIDLRAAAALVPVVTSPSGYASLSLPILASAAIGTFDVQAVVGSPSAGVVVSNAWRFLLGA